MGLWLWGRPQALRPRARWSWQHLLMLLTLDLQPVLCIGCSLQHAQYAQLQASFRFDSCPWFSSCPGVGKPGNLRISDDSHANNWISSQCDWQRCSKRRILAALSYFWSTSCLSQNELVCWFKLEHNWVVTTRYRTYTGSLGWNRIEYPLNQMRSDAVSLSSLQFQCPWVMWTSQHMFGCLCNVNLSISGCLILTETHIPTLN